MKRLGIIFILSFFVMVLIMGQALSAVPPVLTDNFDNPDNWSYLDVVGAGPVAEITGNRLVITIPRDSAYVGYLAFSAGIQSAFQLQGDFDVQVDYELLPDASGVIPTATGVRAGICVPPYIPPLSPISRASFNNDPYTVEAYEVQFDPFTFGFVETSDTSGTLRLTRSTKNGQAIMQGYFLGPTGKWVPLTKSVVENNTINIQLAAWANSASFAQKDVKVAFDNFIIKSGTIISDTETPAGTFASGKGWLKTPDGKANFNFTATLDGDGSLPAGQFTFKQAALIFSSSSLESLEIMGKEALISGTGSVNGQGSYYFTLTAYDGEGNGLDTFGLKIYDTTGTFYELASTPLSGGNIEVN